MKIYLVGLLFLLVTSAMATDSLASGDDKFKSSNKKKRVNGKLMTVVNTSSSWTKTIEIPAIPESIKTCEVDISTDYWQQDKFVKVKAFIDRVECGASSGVYTVLVRTNSEGGEMHTEKYSETWSRSNDEAIESIHKYSMNGDTDLVRVRIKLPPSDACVCDEAGQSK